MIVFFLNGLAPVLLPVLKLTGLGLMVAPCSHSATMVLAPAFGGVWGEFPYPTCPCGSSTQNKYPTASRLGRYRAPSLCGSTLAPSEGRDKCVGVSHGRESQSVQSTSAGRPISVDIPFYDHSFHSMDFNTKIRVHGCPIPSHKEYFATVLPQKSQWS